MFIEEVRTLDDARKRGEEIIRSSWVSGYTLEKHLTAMRQLIERVELLATTGWTGRHVTFDDGTGERIGGVVSREPWGRVALNVSIKSDDGRTFVRLVGDVTIDRVQPS
jgi:hypothetical protein